MEKKYCPTHHFFYSSPSCPYCAKDRWENYQKKLNKEEKKVKTQEDKREPSKDEIEQLLNKFNSPKK